MNYPIKMFDIDLQCDVDVYKIGQPDSFGAHTLIWYNGNSTVENAPTKPQWMAKNILHLKPSSSN